MTLEHAIEHYHHDLFLTTLIQLFEMSPDRVKEICSTIDYFKDGLLNLKSSYPNDVEYEVRYIILIIIIMYLFATKHLYNKGIIKRSLLFCINLNFSENI